MREDGTTSSTALWVDPPPVAPAARTLVVMAGLSGVQPTVGLLDETERARAARLRTAELRQNFIAAHVVVRQVLGWALGCDPTTLVFDIDAHGKPHLRGHDLRFNLSHSGSHALVALGRVGRIGVDLEVRERLGDADRLAPRILAQVELDAFTALPLAERADALLRAWTRKEAVLKAIGLGLPGGMEHVILGDPPHLVGDFTALPQLAGLAVHDLPVDPAFVAAVALDRDAAAPLTIRWRARTDQ